MVEESLHSRNREGRDECGASKQAINVMEKEKP